MEMVTSEDLVCSKTVEIRTVLCLILFTYISLPPKWYSLKPPPEMAVLNEKNKQTKKTSLILKQPYERRILGYPTMKIFWMVTSSIFLCLLVLKLTLFSTEYLFIFYLLIYLSSRQIS